MSTNIYDLLNEMMKRGASDLHLGAGRTPYLRIDERLVPAGKDVLNADSVKDLIYSIITKEQQARFERDKELDFAFTKENVGRFRVNVFWQRGYVGVAIRALPFNILSFEECGLPVRVVEGFCNKPKGLVLVTGATGSGKSTTLASMVDWINTRKDCHIITIEDPVEYVHANKKSIVEQREVGSDTHSFSSALKHVLREDPDVILIGEMRDLETIESALIIAETGHLVFATLHTSDSVQTVNRIIDVFPARQQPQVRAQLSFVLLGILSQQLIPRASEAVQQPSLRATTPKVSGRINLSFEIASVASLPRNDNCRTTTSGKGRVLAVEVLVANHAIRSQIRESKVHQIYSSLQTGQREYMQTMNQSLFELFSRGEISKEDALGRTTEPQDMERMMREKR